MLPNIIYNNDSLLNNLITQSSAIIITKEQKEICQLLKPLKEKIIQIILTKGPVSLTASMLEVFYDNKKLILTKEEINEGIKKKMKYYMITIFEGSIIYYLNINNSYSKISQIVNKNECFEEVFNNGKECIQINHNIIKNNLPNIYRELIGQYNILICNPEVLIELEGEEDPKTLESDVDNNIKFNEDIKLNDYINTKIIKYTGIRSGIEKETYINNNEITRQNNINFSNDIKPNKYLIKIAEDENNRIENTIESNTKINQENFLFIKDITNNNTNKEGIKENENPDIDNNINIKKDSKLNLYPENSNIIKNENENENVITNENKIKEEKLFINKGKKHKKHKKRRIGESFLKKKKKLTNDSFVIPYSSNEINNHYNSSTGVNTNNSPNLSVESLSFSCVSKKKEKNLLEQIINYISEKNHKIISIFDGENIKEREEKKIMELKKEISQKELEIKMHEYFMQSLDDIDINLEKEKNNINQMEKINEGIKTDYQRLNEEMEILFASQFILNKRNRLKNEENAVGLMDDFIYNFNICVELMKKIKSNKNKYILCLKKIYEFIKNANKIGLNINKEEKGDKINNIIIYKEEKETIGKIGDCLKVFENLLKKNINKSLLNTPFENLLKEVNIEKDLFILNK